MFTGSAGNIKRSTNSSDLERFPENTTRIQDGGKNGLIKENFPFEVVELRFAGVAL